MSESIFSDQWYKLSSLHPSLRPTVSVERQWVRGELWYLLTASAGSSTYRLNRTAYSFIGRCNGKRTVQELWDELLAESPEATLTQHEAIEMLITVQGRGFVEFERTADAKQLIDSIDAERSQENRVRLNPLAFRVKLGNPQGWLSRLEWLAPVIFGWVGLIVFSLALLIGGYIVSEDSAPLAIYAQQWLQTPRLILIVWLVYPFIKFVHESAHALAVMRWGGRVQEMGVSLMMLFPVPYVDASDANRFARPYQRALVGAAGIAAELFIAVIGLIIWRVSQPGYIQDIGFVIAFTGGVSTIVFNGNPLMKMDAYYVLADVLQMPNLAQRSQQYFVNLLQRFVLGIKQGKKIVLRPGERFWLATYSPLAWLYRALVSIWMVVWLGDFSPALGYGLALLVFVTMLIVPLFKGISFLRKDVARGPGSGYLQTNMRALSLAALFVALLALVPFPERRIIAGVVWLPDKAQLKTASDGFVAKSLFDPGQLVVPGTAVLELYDPAVQTEQQRLLARMEGAQAALYQALVTDTAKSRQYQLELEQVGRELQLTQQKLGDLTVKSQAQGRAYLKDPNDLEGRFFKRGETIGFVMPAAMVNDQPSNAELAPVVRVAVEQDDVALLKGRVTGVQVRVVGSHENTMGSSLIRDTPAALSKLPSAALGEQGGGELVVDPQDKDGLRTVRPSFAFDVALPRFGSTAVGQRAWVRFDLGYSPLLMQLGRRIQQTVLMRFAPRDL